MTDQLSNTINTTPLTSKQQPVIKSRTTEFYGFVAWASTSLLFIIYLLWALLPDETIESLGIDWYPNREWSILIPAWSIIVVILTYIVYWSLALLGTPSFSELSTITDEFIHLPSDQVPNPYIASTKPGSIPELYDIPIGMVNRVLYGKKPTTTQPASGTEPTIVQ